MPEDFAGEDLSGKNLARADLAGANLTEADLTGANLSYAALESDLAVAAQSYNQNLVNLPVLIE